MTVDNHGARGPSTIAVDLDGTLAEYNGWVGYDHIGEPIGSMVSRVKTWLSEGKVVVIFTARAYPPDNNEHSVGYIKKWCVKHIGVELPVTCIKTPNMSELWDDRCVQVIPNTGVRADGEY